HERVKHRLRLRRPDNPQRQRKWKRRRMRVIAFRGNTPDVRECSGFRRKPEARLGDEIDDFESWQEEPAAEVDTPRSIRNDDLTGWPAVHDLTVILEQPSLNPPLVVVEDRAMLRDEPHHLGKAAPLPRQVALTWQIITVAVVAVQHDIGIGRSPGTVP